eukprot:4967946-Heterocapsa_arctica.AAC.1
MDIAVAAAQPTDLYQIFERSGCIFLEFVEAWMHCAIDCNAACSLHCGKTFESKRDLIVNKLLSLAMKDVSEFIQKHSLLKDPTVVIANPKVDIFPSERQSQYY